jgi:hypothetical protein
LNLSGVNATATTRHLQRQMGALFPAWQSKTRLYRNRTVRFVDRIQHSELAP